MRASLFKPLTEAQFQSQVIELAQRYRWRVAHFRSVAVTRKDGSVRYQTPVQADGVGFPDLVCTRAETILVAELKVGRNKVTPEQEAWLAAFRNAGAVAVVWRSSDWNEIERMLA